MCTTWEDVCWAHLRCWLDLAVDARLCAEPDADGALPGAEWALAGAAGAAGGSAQEVAEGLEVAKGGWPLDRCRCGRGERLGAGAWVA